MNRKEEESLQIFGRMLNGTLTPPINVPRDGLLFDLQMTIERTTNIASAQQRLSFYGEPLDDRARSLASYGIRSDQSTVQIEVRPGDAGNWDMSNTHEYNHNPQLPNSISPSNLTFLDHDQGNLDRRRTIDHGPQSLVSFTSGPQARPLSAYTRALLMHRLRYRDGPRPGDTGYWDMSNTHEYNHNPQLPNSISPSILTFLDHDQGNLDRRRTIDHGPQSLVSFTGGPLARPLSAYTGALLKHRLRYRDGRTTRGLIDANSTDSAPPTMMLGPVSCPIGPSPTSQPQAEPPVSYSIDQGSQRIPQSDEGSPTKNGTFSKRGGTSKGKPQSEHTPFLDVGIYIVMTVITLPVMTAVVSICIRGWGG